MTNEQKIELKKEAFRLAMQLKPSQFMNPMGGMSNQRDYTAESLIKNAELIYKALTDV